MNHTGCNACKSYALARVKRSTLTRLKHPGSRQYICLDCNHKTLVDRFGQYVGEKENPSDSTDNTSASTP